MKDKKGGIVHQKSFVDNWVACEAFRVMPPFFILEKIPCFIIYPSLMKKLLPFIVVFISTLSLYSFAYDATPQDTAVLNSLYQRIDIIAERNGQFKSIFKTRLETIKESQSLNPRVSYIIDELIDYVSEGNNDTSDKTNGLTDQSNNNDTISQRPKIPSSQDRINNYLSSWKKRADRWKEFIEKFIDDWDKSDYAQWVKELEKSIETFMDLIDFAEDKRLLKDQNASEYFWRIAESYHYIWLWTHLHLELEWEIALEIKEFGLAEEYYQKSYDKWNYLQWDELEAMQSYVQEFFIYYEWITYTECPLWYKHVFNRACHREKFTWYKVFGQKWSFRSDTFFLQKWEKIEIDFDITSNDFSSTAVWLRSENSSYWDLLFNVLERDDIVGSEFRTIDTAWNYYIDIKADWDTSRSLVVR